MLNLNNNWTLVNNLNAQQIIKKELVNELLNTKQTKYSLDQMPWEEFKTKFLITPFTSKLKHTFQNFLNIYTPFTCWMPGSLCYPRR